MIRQDHVSIRTCVVCGTKRSKPALLRLALDEASIVIDRAQRRVGRGAYVCRDCLPQLRLTKRVQKAFRHRAQQIAPETSFGPQFAEPLGPMRCTSK